VESLTGRITVLLACFVGRLVVLLAGLVGCWADNCGSNDTKTDKKATIRIKIRGNRTIEPRLVRPDDPNFILYVMDSNGFFIISPQSYLLKGNV